VEAGRDRQWAADLVDVEHREVGLAVHADEDVFRQELEDVFGRAWSFVAHVSEIENAGDYVTRYIGADPVIVCRDADETVRVLLNTCAHKGAALCREDAGHAEKFVCPYHGWAYRTSGQFLGAPFEKQVYGSLDHSRLGLVSARVDQIAGLIFATWDAEAPSLRDYLGGYAGFLEAAFDRTESGLTVIGPPQRWILHANWKMAAEQFSGDGYHVVTTHLSFFQPEMGFFGPAPEGAGNNDAVVGTLYGVDVSVGGHGGRCIDLEQVFRAQSQAAAAAGQQAPSGDFADLDPDTILRMSPPPGLTPELVEQLIARGPRERLELLASIPPTLGTVFPNFIWMCPLFPDLHNNGVASFHDIKVLRPLAPDRTEVWTWALMERDMPTPQQATGLQSRTFMLGPSGAIEQDDFEVWSRIQTGVQGPIGRKAVARYPALTAPDTITTYPGTTTWRDLSRDNGPWNFFLRWRDFMTGKPW
jgi:nitrite reductase/ring-hydroxylating ferredoxin subunit